MFVKQINPPLDLYNITTTPDKNQQLFINSDCQNNAKSAILRGVTISAKILKFDEIVALINKMVSDFCMIPLVFMLLYNHSPFYFSHHNVLNVELNI